VDANNKAINFFFIRKPPDFYGINFQYNKNALPKTKTVKILLSEIMYSKNISVRQLSARSGISKSTIDNIMNEVYSPTMENMELLAKALKVRITDLFESDYK